jgi:hypothetical protein
MKEKLTGGGWGKEPLRDAIQKMIDEAQSNKSCPHCNCCCLDCAECGEE